MSEGPTAPSVITVVIPTFNHLLTLRLCLEHLEAQTLTNFDVIVINDGSTDGIEAALTEIQQTSPLRMQVLHQQYAGHGRQLSRNDVDVRGASPFKLEGVYCRLKLLKTNPREIFGGSYMATSAQVIPTRHYHQRFSVSSIIMITLAATLFLVGFFLNWDPDGGARFDLYRFHLPAIYLFHNQPWSHAVRDYSSATTPLFHMLESLNPLLGYDTAFRAVHVGLALLQCSLFVYAVYRRFEEDNLGFALVLGATLLVSPFYMSMSYWPVTDAMPLWFVLVVFLLIRRIMDGHATRNTQSPYLLAIIALTALVSSAAFYTRQNYLFLPMFALVLFFQAWPKMRAAAFITFALFAIPGLYLVMTWKGFTPPSFQVLHQGTSMAIALYPLTMVAFYSLPFLIELTLQRGIGGVLPFSRRGWIVIASGGILCLLIFLRFRLPTGPGGGIASKLFEHCGKLGAPFFVLFAYAGLIILIQLFRNLNWQTSFLLIALLAPTLTMKIVYQRYYDPLLFILFWLYFDKDLVCRFVSVRTGMICIGFSFALLLGCLKFHS
jgi:glycosyltransferase involved in cell wall biosynthesis